MENDTAPKLLRARRKHSQIFVAVVVCLIAFAAPLLPMDSLSRMVMVVLGYALCIICVFGRSYASLFIGGRKNDEVVRQGPFSVVRNPLYVFSFLGTVGVGLMSGMFSLTFLLGAAFCFYYPLVVAREEEFLLHKFGDTYKEYQAEVPRWFPRLSQYSEPEQIETTPRLVRKTMRDAAMFFLPYPCFLLLAYLHASNVLPTLLRLP